MTDVKKENIIGLSFMSAIGLTIYIALVTLIMNNAEKVFGSMKNYLGPVAFLLLFVLSATVTGSLVFGKPIMLYLEKQKTEAVKLFLFTVGWIFVITLVVFGLLILLR
ncbi:MAG: hypothetical protein WC663_01065 [Patescibacteria group bacterium]|jgi:hypothetical protein